MFQRNFPNTKQRQARKQNCEADSCPAIGGWNKRYPERENQIMQDVCLWRPKKAAPLALTPVSCGLFRGFYVYMNRQAHLLFSSALAKTLLHLVLPLDTVVLIPYFFTYSAAAQCS